MNFRALVLLPILLALAWPETVAAEESKPAESGKIYRTVDEHGNVVFTDKAGPRSREVKVSEPMTFKGREMTQSLPRGTRPTEKLSPPEETGPAYSTLAILSPANDDAIRNNAGNIEITFKVSPAVRPGHSLQLMINGEVAREPTASGTIAFEHMDRGTHTVHLRVIERESGEVIQDGDPISFTLLRHSIQH